jgi:hypothetical protein
MAKKPTQFTFKTEKSTGRYRSFYPDSHYIKLQGKQVGSISDDLDHKISFMVKVEPTTDKPANFKHVTLTRQFTNLMEAKYYLNANFEKIIQQFDLYQLPD